MHEAVDAEAEVLWLQEGDAWVGTLCGEGDPCLDNPGSRRDAFEVELLLRATDWQVEMWQAARGAFAREHIEAADLAEARVKAATLLCDFRNRITAACDSG